MKICFIHLKNELKINFFIDFKNPFFKVIIDNDLVYQVSLIKFEHRIFKISLFEFAIRKNVSISTHLLANYFTYCHPHIKLKEII